MTTIHPQKLSTKQTARPTPLLATLRYVPRKRNRYLVVNYTPKETR